MALHRNCLRSSLLAIALAAPILAVQVPAGAELEARLKTKISTTSSRAKDPVEAILIAPVMVSGQFVIPAGATLRGAITEVKPPEETVRAELGLNFTELQAGAVTLKISTLLTAVENARESVTADGKIQGILASETISARLDQGINKVAQKYSGFGGILEAAKDALVGETNGDITYDAGVEFTLKITEPLSLTAKLPPGPAAALEPIAGESALVALANRQPFESRAQHPPKPSDITSLMFIGSQEEVESAFTDAGWHSAARLNDMSKFETVRAIAADHGYSEAPVSILYLDGRPPDLVFEKTNNTFSKRDHLRIWRRPDTFAGQPVWVCAATHDININFSPEDRTFIHKIDPQIDKERAKVVNDLLLTGKVRSLALVDRPAVPQHGQNATGDNLDTDGKMAVLILKRALP